MIDYPCIKVCDDLLFVRIDSSTSSTTYRCIHLPTLVATAQLPGGSIDLTENAFAPLLPECKLETRTKGLFDSVHEEIYSIPSCLPKRPRYCFIVTRLLGSGKAEDWEIFEVEIDLCIPGPIKIFSRVSRQYTVARPTNFYLNNHNVDDLLLSVGAFTFFQPIKVRFLQVGKPDVWREVKLGGVNKTICLLAGLHVDRDAGYIIALGSEGILCPQALSFIWWIDDRKLDAVVQRRTGHLDGVIGLCRAFVGILRRILLYT